VISFPNCKINLGLNIVGKRSDGYHDLETVFVPVPFEDCLEIGRATGESTISIAGLSIDGNVESNLCWKAYQLLKNRFDLPAIDIKLYKQIPTGAGLGGGSSNAAFTLRLLNEKFNLQIQQHELIDFASQLGSDCAFFIINQPCIGSGRGEVLTPISVPQLDEMFGGLRASFERGATKCWLDDEWSRGAWAFVGFANFGAAIAPRSGRSGGNSLAIATSGAAAGVVTRTQPPRDGAVLQRLS